MGMYDEILVEYPLKGYEFLQNEIFQTKDFDNVMTLYKITKEGRLLEEEVDFEFVPEEKRPYYGKEEWNQNPLFRVFGSVKRNRLGWKDTNYHGIFRFYTMENDKWYEFEAKFTDGNLIYIKLIEED